MIHVWAYRGDERGKPGWRNNAITEGGKKYPGVGFLHGDLARFDGVVQPTSTQPVTGCIIVRSELAQEAADRLKAAYEEAEVEVSFVPPFDPEGDKARKEAKAAAKKDAAKEPA